MIQTMSANTANTANSAAAESSVERLSIQLNDEQRAVVAHRGSPLLVFAAAGTGKTQALTARIAGIVLDDRVPPKRVLALTFTRKAAKEMRLRAAQLCGCSEEDLSSVGTFHSFCVRFLRRFGHHVAPGLRQFTIVGPEDSKKIFEECLPQAKFLAFNSLSDNYKSDEDNEDPSALVSLIMANIERWRNDGLSPERARIEAGEGMPLRMGAMTCAMTSASAGHTSGSADSLRLLTISIEAYSLYRDTCIRMGIVDFSDLILHTIDVLEKREDVVRECREEMFSHMMVDEFQDTNPAQMMLVQLLCERKRRGGDKDKEAKQEKQEEKKTKSREEGEGNGEQGEQGGEGKEGRRGGEGQIPSLCEDTLMVVGDDYQAIHEWRGATVQNITEFGAAFPSSRIIHLKVNYRSRPDILSTATRLISHNPNQCRKELLPHRSERSDRADGGTAVRVRHCVSVWSEAKEIARALYNRSPEDKARDVAILYRVNSQSQPIEEELLLLGVPYTVRGSTSFFTRAEVKDCLAFARFLAAPGHSDAEFRRILNVPRKGLGNAVMQLLEKVRERMAVGRSSEQNRDHHYLADEPVQCNVSLWDAAKHLTTNPEEAMTAVSTEGAYGERAHRKNRWRRPPKALDDFVDAMRTCVREAADAEEKALEIKGGGANNNNNDGDDTKQGPHRILLNCLERVGYIAALKKAPSPARSVMMMTRDEEREEEEGGSTQQQAREEDDGFGSTGERESRLANVDAFIQMAARDPDATLSQFVDRCLLESAGEDHDNERSGEGGTREGRVTLMTLHASKGLEFSTVYLTGSYEDSLPHYRSVRENKVEQERRLFYVGLTRARDELVVTVPHERIHFGRRERLYTSRFVGEMRSGRECP